jgi:thymidylate kinase
MGTVAIIGADGAGKTTIANKLMRSFPLPMKYLYMGMNPQSSNFALPTSRIIYRLKMNRFQRQSSAADNSDSTFLSLHTIEHRQDRRGRIGAAARLLNRLAEETYRQLVSWTYQFRGYIVLYDRHFLFDFSSKSTEESEHSQRVSSRIHLWFLNHIYPKPDLIVFLDAPPEVLITRKQEVPLEYLQARREAFLDKGEEVAGFIRVDADRPLDSVYEEVSRHIMQFYDKKGSPDESFIDQRLDRSREAEPRLGYSKRIGNHRKEI